MSKINNPRFPHTCKIVRYASQSPMSDDDAEGTVIYEGECRSYPNYTTSLNGEVITSGRKVALPVVQQDWTEDTIPCEGDTIVVTKSGYKEEGKVIDRLPNNLGTDLLWKYSRG